MASAAPIFAAGETDAVIDYADRELPKLGARLGLDESETDRLHRLFMAALRANAARMSHALEAPLVEAIPESRELITALGEMMIESVDTDGLEHVGQATEFMADGGNVLLVSNHTSGADTLVLDHVVNRAFPGATHDWLFMAGHVVNYFLLPLALAGGLHRIQIFSAKYCAHAGGDVLSRMKENNAKALMSIGPRVMQGGVCIGLYPEGGRGNGQLLAGEPRTMKIPQLMSMVSPNGLMILPSYVEATDIQPVVRGDNEFNEYLVHARRGSATLRFAPGVMWEDLQPSRAEVADFLAGHHDQCLGNTEHALKQCLIEKIMRLIAGMAPMQARGRYAA